MVILAIESSCDDTAAAVVADGHVLSNIIATQKIHELYGGVVPEMASRAHINHIVPVVDLAMRQAGVSQEQIQAVAFTQAPGLIGSLLVGACFAQGFAQALNIPLIGVHHMHAHIMAHFIDAPLPQFPFLCLTVSGGHTQLVLCEDHLNVKVVGETRDDAAGEAFDKVAKMLGLPYPGGPLIDKTAAGGDPHKFKFPLGLLPNLEFSFSGLKTSVLRFLEKGKQQSASFVQDNLQDICASVQHTIVQTLLEGLAQAATQYNVQHVGIAGGVSANSALRAALQEMGKQKSWQTFIPEFQYCTDNAAMIGMAAHFKSLQNMFVPLGTVPSARANFVP